MKDLHCYRTGVEGRLSQQKLKPVGQGRFLLGESTTPTRLRFVRQTERLCRVFAHPNHDWGTAYVYEADDTDEVIVPGRFRWAVDGEREEKAALTAPFAETMQELLEQARQASHREPYGTQEHGYAAGQAAAYEKALGLLKEA